MKVKDFKNLFNGLDDEADIVIVAYSEGGVIVDDIMIMASANDDNTAFYLYTEQAWKDINDHLEVR